jgi:putative membrane protein
MYNRTNLPLEKRKIIKKSIGSIIGCVVAIAVIVGGLAVMKGFGEAELGTWFFNLIGVIQISTASFFIIIALLNILYQYLYYKFYYYNFEEETGEIKKGVISLATGHVYYSRIQNIYVDQDILDRMFGLYDVHYETAGDTSSFYSHVDGLNKTNADLLVKFIIEKSKNKPHSQSTVSENAPTETTKKEETPVVSQKNDGVSISKSNMPISGKFAFSMALRITAGLAFILIMLFISAITESSTPDLTTGAGLDAIIYFAILMLIFIFSYLYSLAWVHFFDFNFDFEKGTMTSGVIARQTKIIYYNRVQNINIGQGIMERILGIYSINIETAAAGDFKNLRNQGKQNPSIAGLSKENAEKLKNFLIEKTKIYQANI